jgi:hypothetical protein
LQYSTRVHHLVIGPMIDFEKEVGLSYNVDDAVYVAWASHNLLLFPRLRRLTFTRRAWVAHQPETLLALASRLLPQLDFFDTPLAVNGSAAQTISASIIKLLPTTLISLTIAWERGSELPLFDEFWANERGVLETLLVSALKNISSLQSLELDLPVSDLTMHHLITMPQLKSLTCALTRTEVLAQVSESGPHFPVLTSLELINTTVENARRCLAAVSSRILAHVSVLFVGNPEFQHILDFVSFVCSLPVKDSLKELHILPLRDVLRPFGDLLSFLSPFKDLPCIESISFRGSRFPIDYPTVFLEACPASLRNLRLFDTPLTRWTTLVQIASDRTWKSLPVGLRLDGHVPTILSTEPQITHTTKLTIGRIQETLDPVYIASLLHELLPELEKVSMEVGSDEVEQPARRDWVGKLERELQLLRLRDNQK